MKLKTLYYPTGEPLANLSPCKAKALRKLRFQNTPHRDYLEDK